MSDWKKEFDNWKPHTIPQAAIQTRVLVFYIVVPLVVLYLAWRWL